MFLTMPNQTAAANARPFHCMMPTANEADGPEPLSALRREMKLLLIEQNLMRIELDQRRAAEAELREAKELIIAYVERVEQLSAMEAERKRKWNSGDERRNARAQEKPSNSRWGWYYLFRLKCRLVALRLTSF
jgi:hypothetical protein